MACAKAEKQGETFCIWGIIIRAVLSDGEEGRES